jgi:hypothetical protein
MISRAEITTLGSLFGYDPALIKAFIDVEGSGAGFDIYDTEFGTFTAAVSTTVGGGTNYRVGHKIKVLGSQIGGVDVTNDAILTVTAATSGVIDTVSITGTAAGITAVTYNDVSQFTEYQNLSIDTPRIDCVYQSMFSLGLRDVNKAKQNSINVNTYGTAGVSRREVNTYITNAFQLSKKEKVKSRQLILLSENPRPTVVRHTIHKFFNPLIKNGYATTVSVAYTKYNIKYGHRIVMYKYNNKLYFFDPQKKYQTNMMYNSTNIFDLFNKNATLTDINYIVIYNLTSPKLLVNTTCDLPYVG